MIKTLERYPSIIEKSANDLDPSLVAVYLYDLSKAFSSFYRDCSILAIAQDEKTLAQARLQLAKTTLTVMKNAMDLLLIPYLDRM